MLPAMVPHRFIVSECEACGGQRTALLVQTSGGGDEESLRGEDLPQDPERLQLQVAPWLPTQDSSSGGAETSQGSLVTELD